MTTYSKLYKDIERHEGNLADIVIEFTNFDPTGLDFTLQVRDKNRNLILEKSTIAGSGTENDFGISTDNKYLTIVLHPEDTEGKVGIHDYEIDFLNTDGQPFVTIGGLFEIIKQINTL